MLFNTTPKVARKTEKIIADAGAKAGMIQGSTRQMSDPRTAWNNAPMWYPEWAYGAFRDAYESSYVKSYRK